MFGHLGEDVVSGAVDDAHDCVYRLACKRHLERANERYAAGYGRLEIQTHSAGPSCSQDFCTVAGQQFFVGGD